MATEAQIVALRLLIAEQDESTYSNVSLSDRIDGAAGELNLVAFNVWTEKAARYATLVNISEGGSTRQNGDLMDKALKMVSHFKSLLPDGTGTGAAPSVRIKRLTR
jgi:hypothetical protein